MWIACYESRNFSFFAYGTTEQMARESLIKGLKTHGKQYDCEPDWYSPDDLYSYPIEIREGCCYRDGSLLSEGV
jgi:hypothetical protein